MKKIYIVVSFIIIAAMIFAGCSAAPSSQNQSDSSYNDVNKGETAGEEAAPPMEAPQAEPEQGVSNPDVLGSGSSANAGIDQESILQPGVNRKIVYNGTIEAETKNFDNDCDMILSKLIEFGGYVESSTINGTKPEDWQDEGRYAQMTLRIPSEKFDAFIKILKGVGKNVSSSVSGQDISLQYYDTETQLSTLRNRQSRLEEMLTNPAYTLDSIIQLEQELADVSYQIQMLETNLRTYDSLIDFSTVNITLHEVMEVTTVTTPAEEDLGTRISNGFYSVLNAVVDFGEGLVWFFAAGSPIIVPLAVIIVLIIILVKRSQRKRKAMAFPNYPQGGQNNVGQQ